MQLKVRRDWLLLLAWMGVIYYFSSQSQPAVLGVEIGVVRKLMHVVEYLVLFGLWWRALRGTLAWDARWLVRAALVATLVYAISDEMHQLSVARRDGNALDVLINVALPSILWLRLEARRTKAPRPLSRPQTKSDSA